MQKNSLTLTWVFNCGILVALLACFTACRSTPYSKGDAAAISLQTAAAEVQAESHSLDTAMAALNDLVSKPAPDLRPQFRAFSIALQNLTVAAHRTETTGQRVRQKSVAYFDDWDKQLATMNFEYIRQSSQARKAQVSNQVSLITRRYDETREAVQPLIAYLTDIRRALGTDLTLGGLESVKSVVSNASDNATKLRSALARLSDDLTTSGFKLSSVALQTAPTAASRPDTTPPATESVKH